MNRISIMKVIGSSLLVLTPFLSAVALRLTPEQALKRLEDSSTRFRMPGNASYRLAHIESAASEPRLYVFNNGDEGFVIASADDVLPPLLGYSDNGAFNLSDASPELKWWLSQYADEAAWYLQNSDGVQSSSVGKGGVPSRAPRADISELLTSKWNQDSPFNLDCPEVGGIKCVTGCVATAMAQVIRYHGYPAQGSGHHSYSWNGRTLDFNYGATTFDYADMLDWYDETATPIQQQAVASLMYACGVGVNMSYSADESGAGDMYIPYALKTFFNYDASTRLLKRNCFSTEEWEDLVYGELEANRPVIYGGQASSGGHQFVCDGYENGYFHINWGWAGMGDGYFLLSALDPGLQGIGGFAGGYNSDQTMVCSAAPAQGGAQWYPIYATGGLEIRQVYDGNIAVELAFKNGGMYNYSPEAADLSFYLKCVSESGREFMSENPMDLQFGGASGLNVSGYRGFSIYLPSNLEEGNYKVSLVFKTPEGNWQDVLFPLSVASYFSISIDSDGRYVFAEGTPEVKAKVKVTAFAPSTTVLSGVPTRFDMTIENIGEVEFSNAITVKVYEKGKHTDPLAVNGVKFTLAAGEVFNGWLELTYSLADGEYDVIIYDNYDEVISDVFTLVIGERPVNVSRILLDTTEASIEEGSTLQLVATVLPEDASDKSLIWSSSDPEIANVDQTGLVTAFTSGKTIITVKSAANEDISASCQITVKARVIEAEGVTLDKSEATLTEGETLTLTATVEPDDTTDKTLTWTSSNEEVATVEDSVVTALKTGTSTITVSTSNGKTAQCEITVIEKVPEIIYVSSVTLDHTEIEAEAGTVLTLKATVLPENATDKDLLWTSSNEEVATVDQTGTVTIRSVGTVVITAEAVDGSGIKAECHISGTSLLNSIESDTIKVDVFTVNGILIKSNVDGSFVSNLSKGTYIVRIGNETHKIIK